MISTKPSNSEPNKAITLWPQLLFSAQVQPYPHLVCNPISKSSSLVKVPFAPGLSAWPGLCILPCHFSHTSIMSLSLGLFKALNQPAPAQSRSGTLAPHLAEGNHPTTRMLAHRGLRLRGGLSAAWYPLASFPVP